MTTEEIVKNYLQALLNNKKEELIGFNGWSEAEKIIEQIKTWNEEVKKILERIIPTSYYTSEQIVKFMWEIISKIGWKGGKAIEPAVGNGRFIYYQPKAMFSNTQWIGVDKDPYGIKSCTHLFPLHYFYCQNFQDIPIKKEDFNLVITSIPYSTELVYDQLSTKHFFLHDFFLLKISRIISENGIVAIAIDSDFMDNQKGEVRELIGKEGLRLIVGYRIPSIDPNRKKGTDLLFFQKRIKGQDSIAWKQSMGAMNFNLFATKANLKEISKRKGKIRTDNKNEEIKNQQIINQYFWEYPENIIGKLEFIEEETRIIGELDIELLKEKSNSSHGWGKINPPPIKSWNLYIPHKLRKNIKNDFLYYGGKYYLVDGITMNDFPSNKERVIKILEDLIESYQECCDAHEKKEPKTLSIKQNSLKENYLRFVRSEGYINSPHNIEAFGKITIYEKLRTLETLTPTAVHSYPSIQNSSHHYKMTAIFEEQLFPDLNIEEGSISNNDEAIMLSMNIKGKIDLSYMAKITGKSEEEIEQQIIPNICLYDPETSEIKTKDQYLSGDLGKKIQVIESLLLNNDKNKDLWEKVHLPLLKETIAPFLLPPKDTVVYEKVKNRLIAEGYKVNEKESIEITNLGWIPVEIIQDFAQLLTGIKIKIFKLINGSFLVECPKHQKNAIAMKVKWGIPERGFHLLLEDLLTLRRPKIKKINNEGKKVVDEEKTFLAEQKIENIRVEFINWIWSNPQKGASLTYAYNFKYNSFKHRYYDGENLKLRAQANPEIKLRKHQLNGIKRIMENQSTLLAWAVGSGKTYTMIASAHELKKIGLINRPLIVCPNATIEQCKRDYHELYPLANIFQIQSHHLEDKDELHKYINNNDWDCLIISSSLFDLYITVSHYYVEEYFQKIIDSLTIEKQKLFDEKASDNTARRNEDQIKKHINESKKLIKEVIDGATSHSKQIFLDTLGIDMLLIDEAHEYKNLPFYSHLKAEGLPTNNKTKKAINTFLKVQWILEKKGKVVFATATPIANSIAELWTMQRYLIPDLLESRDLHLFDNWIHLFGQKSIKTELHHIKGLIGKERIRQYNNRREMLQLAFQCIDVVSKDYIKQHKLLVEPEDIIITQTNELTETQQDYLKFLVLRAIDIDNKVVEPSEDNHLKILSDGRKCVLDERLVFQHGENNLNTKINQIIYNTYRVWKETKDLKGTQLLFGDESTPKTDSRFTVYAYIKQGLIALGIPENEIAFIHDYDHSDKRKKAILKHQLSHAVNEGKIRILLGSTKKLGTGVNLQRRIIAMHHINIQFRPIDIEQRNGRGLRQGNLFGKVLIFYYVAKGINETSLDSFLWQIIKLKQDFISSALIDNGKRSIIEPEFNDSDQTLPSSTLMAIAQGNPELQELHKKRKKLEELKMQQKAMEKAEIERLKQIKENKNTIEKNLLILSELENIIKYFTEQNLEDMTIFGVNYLEANNEKTHIVKNVRQGMTLGFKNYLFCIKAEQAEQSISYSLTTNHYSCKISLAELIVPEKITIHLNHEIEKIKLANHDYSLKINNLQEQKFSFTRIDEIATLQDDIALLLDKYGEDGDIPHKDKIQVERYSDFVKYAGVAPLTPLSPDEISTMNTIANSPYPWFSSLQEAIASWQGNDSKAVEKSLLIEKMFDEECIEWEQHPSSTKVFPTLPLEI